MANTMALEAVTEKKGERGKLARLTRNLPHLKQMGAPRPRVHLKPKSC